MNRWAKWLVVFAAVVAAVVIGITAWTAGNRGAGRSQVFADGTRVTLISAEVPDLVMAGPGGSMSLTREPYDGWWRDWLYPKLPPKVRAKLGIPQLGLIGYNTNSLAVWLKFQNASSGKPPRTYFRVRVSDETGIESPDNSQLIGGGGSRPVLYLIPNYPHRSSNVKVRVYQCDATNPAKPPERLTFILHNSTPSNVPSWTPEPLPAARSTNGLEITLASLTTGMTNRYRDALSWNSEDLGGRHYTRAGFTFAENNHPATNWSVVHVTAKAATGETLTANASDRGWVNSRYAFIFAGALWTEEPAWDITAEIQRAADFPPGELWVLRGVSLPSQGSATSVGAATNFGNVRVVFSSLAGFGPGHYAGSWPDGSWAVTAQIELANQPPDVGLALVSATDERGRVPGDLGMTETRTLSSFSKGTTNNLQTFSQSLRVASNAWSLNLTFAVTRRRVVTFRVKPAVAR